MALVNADRSMRRWVNSLLPDKQNWRKLAMKLQTAIIIQLNSPHLIAF